VRARRPIRIERGLIPLIDVFALLIGAAVVLLARAEFDRDKKARGAGEPGGARLVVSCRADGRCFYQGEVLFDEHKVVEAVEARLLARLAEEPAARIALKLPPAEDARSQFRYTDFQALAERWGRDRLEAIP
jgi:hypothetical protein